MSDPFYIIWNPKGSAPPKYQHAILGDAEKEARRLAIENPGNDFFVMASHSRSKAIEPIEVEYYDIDAVPF